MYKGESDDDLVPSNFSLFCDADRGFDRHTTAVRRIRGVLFIMSTPVLVQVERRKEAFVNKGNAPFHLSPSTLASTLASPKTEMRYPYGVRHPLGSLSQPLSAARGKKLGIVLDKGACLERLR